jgi:hypothetical protein
MTDRANLGISTNGAKLQISEFADIKDQNSCGVVILDEKEVRNIRVQTITCEMSGRHGPSFLG